MIRHIYIYINIYVERERYTNNIHIYIYIYYNNAKTYTYIYIYMYIYIDGSVRLWTMNPQIEQHVIACFVYDSLLNILFDLTYRLFISKK